MTPTPAEEYGRRLERHQTTATRYEVVHDRLGLLRLLTFGLGFVAAWWSFQTGALSPVWLLLPLGAFVALVVHHARVRGKLSDARRAAAFYQNGLARIEDRWAGHGRTGEQFDDPHHVYASDLDLFGKGSVFELLCVARTRMGERALARWLLSPAEPSEVRSRQAAARELGEMLELREAWAVMGEDDRVGVHPDALAAWAEAPNRLTRRWIPWAAWSVPVLVAATAAVWIITGIASALLLVLVAAFVLMRSQREALLEVLRHTENDSGDLRLLQALSQRLEAESFRSPELRQRAAALGTRDEAASRALSRLATIVQLVESRRNPILRILDVPLMYSLHVALAAERWRGEHGHRVAEWLGTLADFEALLSLAAYGYEHPEHCLPELVEGGPAVFSGSEIGHPLMARARCVTNDVTIEGQTRVLLVSGSNMSGKSTLLRAIGVNTVLAMAGAPVCARRLRLTPLQVGASIRVNDSLQEGSSRFYAEITRLRQLHELSGRSPPLLFLLDELLQGTNSRDRRIGAEGVVRSFIERGAIGLITTHDLALTDMAAGGGGRLRNLHFEDEIELGRMKFDFQLREGVVTKSNGVALMRAIGLDV